MSSSAVILKTIGVQVSRYNETVELYRLGSVSTPAPGEDTSTARICYTSFTTTEFVSFVLIAFLAGIILTSMVTMWLLNLRLVFRSFILI